MSIKLKVYELAKELSVDSHHLVDVVQRLGIEIKNTMSVLGTEEVKLVREHYRKNRPAGKGAAPGTPAKSNVTEKRVGTTVIRRRAAKATEEKAPEPVAAAAPSVETEESSQAEEVVAQAEVENLEVEASEESDSAAIEATEEVVEAGVQMESAATDAEATPAGTPAEPVAPAKRRFYPSIIKKVATEQYLGEKVGPKVDKPKKEVKPAEKTKPGTTGTTTTTAAAAGTGVKRGIKEIDFAAATTEAAKEAGKRKLLDRQNTVFKSSDYLKREMVHSTKKKKTAISRPALKTQITVPSEHKRVVEMGATVTPAEMAKQMGQKASAVIAKLMNLGATVTMNQPVDHDTAALVCHEFGFEVKETTFKEASFIPTVDISPEKLSPRGPVVTIMGHVDHGKTSLLDAIRKTKVAAGEAGGITQHVGAYTVTLPKGKITFVDTPGHEAFTAMRARGAKVTDLVILVVSAVDGVMPQTLESVNHAKAASVPIIVAVNKIDLPDANPDRIKQTLAGHGLNPEEWGGETQYVSVSAKTGKGIDQLLEGILLQSEMMELKANFDMPARGVVIESRLDKNRGPIASVLVQQGKLKSGDIIVSGVSFGKVRAMTGSDGTKMTVALPSEPVEILGLPAVPAVGDDVFVVEDEKAAKALTSSRLEKQRALITESKPKMTLEEMMNAAPGTEKELRVILKADVAGSAEALKEALSKFPADKVRIKILHTGTGGITESDVMLASASQAAILGFNIRPDVKAQRVAEVEGVTVRTYTIIYDLLEDIKKLAEGLLSAEIREKVIGRAEVRSVFNIPKVGAIAGSAVIDGKVVRGCYLRLLRDNRVVYEGKISSLRRFKEDVKEVASGFECGIGVENFNDLKLGDQFEAFLKEEHKTSL